MDDRFKHAMDNVEPDESMIERIIKSEVYLFRRALTLLCWGLALASFHINIEGLELALYSSWAGNLLMVLGLWMLRTENKRMTVAYGCGVLTLLTQTISYWLGAFPDTDIIRAFMVGISVISYILVTIKLYCLFSGLRDLALRFENETLAKRLMRCFWLYLSLYLLFFACVVVPFLIYPTALYVVFVLVKLPLTVGKLKQYVPLGRRATTVKAFSWKVWLTLCLYVAVTVAGEFGCLYAINAPKPEAVLYANMPSSETAGIREKLLELGMPDYVLADLPDEEVRLYEEIYAATYEVERSGENVNRDGGILEVSSFGGVMPNGRVRILLYYRWIKLPKHTYIDLLSIPGSLKFLPMSAEPNAKGLSLYDKDGSTYRQTLLNEDELIGYSQGSFSFIWDTPSSGSVAQIQFRLYPNYKNQRGYLAMDAQVLTPDEPMALWLGGTYVHQESLWNRPYFNPLNQTSSNGYSHIQNGGSRAKAFWSEGFDFNLDYAPEGWVWSE